MIIKKDALVDLAKKYMGETEESMIKEFEDNIDASVL